ncbi:MAG: xanthine dehydrogenase [Actinobacteria bacterium]|nr:MAG: xanthine dehydrogenase [Actinomycetota bacterium]
MSAVESDRILADLSTAVNGGDRVVLATIVETKGSVPRHVGTKMVVHADGSIVGTVGGGEVEAAVRVDALAALKKNEPGLHHYTLRDPQQGDPGVCGGTMTVYLETYMTPHTIFVIGCGHVGKAVVDLAHWLGYRTVAVDDRADLVTAEAMPLADIRFHGSVSDALSAHPITENTSVVVVTRSYSLDAQITPLLLETPARYVGVMGSKRRWGSTRELLDDDGVADGALKRVHNPIGLDIGAETVEELAVSIMSEIISFAADSAQ